MRIALILAAAATLSGSLLAQSGSFTCPPGYDTKSGDRFAYPYNLYVCTGLYSNLTFQTTDTGMPTVAVLQQLSYRAMRYESYTTWSGQGRTLTNVTLDLGYAKKTLTTNLATNWSASPTRVYSNNAIMLPTMTSGHSTQTWGYPVAFPFSTVFVFLPNKGDLLQEWNVAGGTLVNGYTGISPFYIDGQYSPVAAIGGYHYVAPSANTKDPNRYLPRYYYNASGACNDSAMSDTNHDAYAYIDLHVYADIFPDANFAGYGRISNSYTYYTAPGKPVVGMLSLWGSDVGVNIGALCNNLHVSPAIPLALIARTAGTSTSDAATGPWFPITPSVVWNDNWAGAVVYWQAAWEDSASKRFSLTNATRLVLPKKPTSKVAPEICQYLHRYTYNSATAASGPYGPYTSSYLNPIEGWNKK